MSERTDAVSRASRAAVQPPPRGPSIRGALRPAATLLALLILATFGLGAVRDDGGADDVAQLLKVRRDLDAGKPARALDRLRKLDASPLADHVALLRARLLREADRHDESLAAVDAGLALDPPTELEARLHEERARVHLARDDRVAAYRSQKRAWETTGDPEFAARLVADLAADFETRGLPGDALRLYRKVWTSWPLAAAAERAWERSEALTAATGAPDPDPADLIQRAERLREAFRCDLAFASYERALRSPELDAAQRARTLRGRAQCLFNRRRYAESAEAWRAIDAAEKNPKAVDAAIRVARSYARAGESTRAIAEFDKILKRAGPVGRARCNYLKGVVLRSSQPARAEALFKKVERQGAAPGLARQARWRLGWADLLEGRNASARRRLAPLAKGSVYDIEVQRARYWMAVLTLAEDPAAGRKKLGALADRIPLSYYGLMAADRIESSGELHRSFVGDRPPERVDHRALRARRLIDAGFPEHARLELQSWLASRRLSRDQRLAAAALLHDVGDHFRAVRTVINGFGGALERGVDPEWKDAWELAWPLPFNDWVKSAVEEFGFDASLVYAVMREESTYRPTVESPAGAIGLMQIIPPTGDRIAANLGVGEFVPGRLKDPVLNIRFGTYYLKSLVGRFEGSQPFAIAAYNAGPEAVNRWLRSDGKLDPDRFVDSVPYGETRRYLRRVLRSQRVYRLLYGLEPRPQG